MPDGPRGRPVIGGRPVSVLIVLAIATVVWLGMTVAVIAAVVQSPAQNAGLGLGVLVVWLALVAFGALVYRVSRGEGP